MIFGNTRAADAGDPWDAEGGAPWGGADVVEAADPSRYLLTGGPSEGPPEEGLSYCSPQKLSSGGESSLYGVLRRLQHEGPLEAAAALARSKPYGTRCLLLLLQSLIGAACFMGLSVLLSLQLPRGLAAASAVDSTFLLLLRSPAAGAFLSLALWLLRQAFAAHQRENFGRERGDPYALQPQQQQQQRAASFIFCLCSTEAWVVLLLWMGGCYTPAAAVAVVPVAAGIRCYIKNAAVDWSYSSSSSSSSSAGYGLDVADSSSSSTSRKFRDVLRACLQTALSAPNFYGVPDVGTPTEPAETLPLSYEGHGLTGDCNSSLGHAAVQMLQRAEGQQQPLLQQGLKAFLMWVDGVLFFSLSGLLLLVLLQLRAALFLLAGGPFLAAACCCHAAATAAAERLLGGLGKRGSEGWGLEEAGGTLRQRLLGAPVGALMNAPPPLGSLALPDDGSCGGAPAGGPPQQGFSNEGVPFAGGLGGSPTQCYGVHRETAPREEPHASEMHQQQVGDSFDPAAAAAAAQGAQQQTNSNASFSEPTTPSFYQSASYHQPPQEQEQQEKRQEAQQQQMLHGEEQQQRQLLQRQVQEENNLDTEEETEGGDTETPFTKQRTLESFREVETR
ncbi:hypothetical protein Esti_001043 [Eimeria stiedai]